MKLQGVDTVKEIVKNGLSVKAICILKSKKNFNKNGIIKCYHFAPFLVPPCCPVFQQNQYGWNIFYRGSVTQRRFLPNYLGIVQADYGGKGF